MGRSIATTAICLWVATLGHAQGARTVQPLPLETVLRSLTIGEYSFPQVSPSGEWVAYTLRKPSGDGTSATITDTVARRGLTWMALGASIKVVNVRTGEARSLPMPDANSYWPSWSPDGRQLAFISDRAAGSEAKVARLWVWDAAKGAVRRVSDAMVRERIVFWSPDGKRILTGLHPDGVTIEEYVASEAGQPKDEPMEPGATVRMYRSAKRADANAPTDGAWSLDRPKMDLGWVDVQTGVIDRLVRNTPIRAVTPSPDGSRIAYTTPVRWEKAGTQQVLSDLVVLTGKTSTVVGDDIRTGTGAGLFAWSPDGTSIAYRDVGMLANGNVYRLDLAGGKPVLLTPDPPRPLNKNAGEAPVWTPSGDAVLFMDEDRLWRAAAVPGPPKELAALKDRSAILLTGGGGSAVSPDGGASILLLTRDQQSGHCAVERVALASGALTTIVREERFYGGYANNDAIGASRDGQRVVFAAQDVSHPPDLYVLDVAKGAVKRLTTNNPDFERFVLGERRIIEWRSIDGRKIRGVLLLPAGYQEGKRYPLIARIYGGSFPSRSPNLFGLSRPPVDNWQTLATRGYAVLLPDLPLNTGTVVKDLVKVLVPGVDKVIEMGIADPEALGVMGHSFGGYSTIAVITETTRFQAAMMSAGLANMFAGYGEMREDGTAYGLAVIEHGQFQVKGTPWEKPELYLENSPVFRFDRVETPLLITHGAADSAVNVSLADEVFVGLRRLGKEVEYARYTGEEHHQAQWRYPNQVDYWNRTIAWFDRFLKKAPAAAPSPSGR